MKFYLASASPRRLEILNSLGLTFDTIICDFKEIIPERHLHPERLATEIAHEKMKRVTMPPPPGIVLTADTLVYSRDFIFGKPSGLNEARRMLKTLAGRSHCVVTAICLRDLSNGKSISASTVTDVTFDPIPAQLLDKYLASGEWQNKAGAYGIQGRASLFTSKIVGCYFNVVGFPVNLFYHCLQQLGYEVDICISVDTETSPQVSPSPADLSSCPDPEEEVDAPSSAEHSC